MFEPFVVVRTRAHPHLIQHELTDSNLHNVRMTPRDDGTIRFDAEKGYPLEKALEANIAGRIRAIHGWEVVG